ncbi:MAG: DUF2884 family protein [Proteobacteria bacterium]|nr:DUF2884 family protein [Pseudomonadota bacterium]
MRARSLVYLVAAAGGLAALAGCGRSDVTVVPSGTAHGNLALRDGQVVLTASDGSQALIAKDGALTIRGAPVAVTDAQRADLARYYAGVDALIAHAGATGLAGAQVGVTAVSSVAEGLAKGDLSRVGSQVEAQARAVKQEAGALCGDLRALRAVQDALVASLQAFQPYAVVGAHDGEDCAQEVRADHP